MAPASEGGARRRHGTVYVDPSGAGKPTDQLAARRVVVLACAPIGGLEPLTIDIVAVDGSLAHIRVLLCCSMRGACVVHARPLLHLSLPLPGKGRRVLLSCRLS